MTYVPHIYFYTLFTAQKMKFSMTDFFSKCDQIRSFLRIWSHLLKKLVMENFIFCTLLFQSNVVTQNMMFLIKSVVALVNTMTCHVNYTREKVVLVAVVITKWTLHQMNIVVEIECRMCVDGYRWARTHVKVLFVSILLWRKSLVGSVNCVIWNDYV